MVAWTGSSAKIGIIAAINMEADMQRADGT